MTLHRLLPLLVVLGLASAGSAQPSDDAPDHRYFVGTSGFVAFNLLPDDYPPRYAQLNVGVHLSPRDALSIEAITWQYYGPLGRQYGPDYGSEASNFPGRVWAYGVGLAYKRELWNGIYAAIHSTPLFQEYLDESGEHIQNGFQLFNAFRAGYHAELFNGRVFIEPSVAITTWPINTNMPESFRAQEDNFPGYFLFEPGLHVGVNF